MANSKYEYVRNFETSSTFLPQTWLVVRLDGRGFTSLANKYRFSKPNDARALELMNYAARQVVAKFVDVCVAYGCSDEFSFVFHPSTELFGRRQDKIVSTVCSHFTAAYCVGWPRYMAYPETTDDARSIEHSDGNSIQAPTELDVETLPTFDARGVCYPTVHILRDYLRWRQVDCHINNLYNTTFWALVMKGGMSNQAAEEFLKGTVSSDKNEILFSRFGINYNNEAGMFKKGSVLFRDVEERVEQGGEQKTSDRSSAHEDEDLPRESLSRAQMEKLKKARKKAKISVEHVDIIQDEFWQQRPWILRGQAPPRS